jgi:GDP-L-fucose synthase
MPGLPKSIFVAGHHGMVGSAVLRRLASERHCNVISAPRKELDLLDGTAVERYLLAHRPDAIVLAAAKVGGIVANKTFPVEFMIENLRMTLNVIQAAYKCGTQRLLFLGSSCIYPREAPQPIPESALLTSPLEETNEAYALAKISGLKLCQYYRKQYGVLYHSAMPTNLYGPGDNYHPEHSHVLPAILRRFHEAKGAAQEEVVLWGTGSPRREFLHVDDLADAIVFLLQLENPPDWVNVGTGVDLTIRELAESVAKEIGYSGRLRWDTSRPDGTPRKLLDVTRMSQLGWSSKIGLREGIGMTYRSFLEEMHLGTLRV